eukprot:m.1458356 g.1458356  ORF g.1458356 m.1458356 type:complete len:272 (-) comp25121_c0_seq94:4489-5304(-)
MFRRRRENDDGFEGDGSLSSGRGYPMVNLHNGRSTYGEYDGNNEDRSSAEPGFDGYPHRMLPDSAEPDRGDYLTVDGYDDAHNNPSFDPSFHNGHNLQDVISESFMGSASYVYQQHGEDELPELIVTEANYVHVDTTIEGGGHRLGVGFALYPSEGIVVSQLEPGGALDATRQVQAGDVITDVNGIPLTVSDVAEAVDIIKSQLPILDFCVRGYVKPEDIHILENLNVPQHRTGGGYRDSSSHQHISTTHVPSTATTYLHDDLSELVCLSR